MAREKLYEYRTIKNQGALLHLIKFQGEDHYKFHKWDGPAIAPFERDSPHLKSYYLNGDKYDYEEYSEIMKERECLPWYKKSMGRAGENRN
jgi:hypothetical protein